MIFFRATFNKTTPKIHKIQGLQKAYRKQSCRELHQKRLAEKIYKTMLLYTQKTPNSKILNLKKQDEIKCLLRINSSAKQYLINQDQKANTLNGRRE